MTQFNLKLIDLVRGNPALYDMSLVSYKDDELKHEIWLNIAKEVGESVEVCRRRWKTFRTRYRKEYLKTEAKNKDGERLANSKWAYYKLLDFLHDHLRPIENEQNCQDGNLENVKVEPNYDDDLIDLFAGRNVQDISAKSEEATAEYSSSYKNSEHDEECLSPNFSRYKRRRFDDIPPSIWQTLAQNCSILNQLADRQLAYQRNDEAAIFGQVVAAKMRKLKNTSKVELGILKILNDELDCQCQST